MIDYKLPSKFVEIAVTKKCNMNCSYCFEKEKENKNIDIAILDDIKNLITLQIRFIGGEPLLNIDFIEKYINKIDDMDVSFELKNYLKNRINIASNGTLIKNKINQLKALNIPISISLDGTEKSNDLDRKYKNNSGTFQDVLKGISLLKENNIPCNITMTLSQNKLFDLFNIFKMILDFSNFKSIKTHINIITNMYYSDKDIDVFLDQQKQIFDYILSKKLNNEKQILMDWFFNAVENGWECKAGVGRISLNEDLSVSPCIAVGMSNHKNKYSSYKGFNLFIDYNRKGRCRSIALDKEKNKTIAWLKACPYHNIESCDSVYYQNYSFNIMIAEYNRFLESLYNLYTTGKKFNFTRQLFVNDMFNIQEINKFTNIEFFSVQAFNNYITNNVYKYSNKNIIINIEEEKDINTLNNILNQYKIDEKIILKYYNHDIIHNMPQNSRFDFVSDVNTIKQIKYNHAILDNKQHWIDIKLTAENYEQQIKNILSFCISDPRFLKLDLKFDYESFEDIKIDELHKLYFYINQLKIWLEETNLLNINNKLILKTSDSPLKCFIDEELNLYLNKQEIYLNLKDLINNFDYIKINKIRKILDIDFVEKIHNKYLIDLYQNKKIMEDHYRIPFITSLIIQWLETND